MPRRYARGLKSENFCTPHPLCSSPHSIVVRFPTVSGRETNARGLRLVILCRYLCPCASVIVDEVDGLRGGTVFIECDATGYARVARHLD